MVRVRPMSHLERSVVLGTPPGDSFERWVRLEDLARIMPCVRSVEALGTSRSRWKVSLWGREVRWVAEHRILVDERRIAWRSVSGRELSGELAMRPSGHGGTIVTVSLDYEVAGPLEWLVDALFGAVDFHLVKSLLHFRSHLEREASRSGIVTGGQRAMPAP